MPRCSTCALASLLLLLAACGRAREVELVEARRGRIEQSFREPARTRLERTWPVAMPVDGRIAPVRLSAGDRVEAGQALVELDRVPHELRAAEARAAALELEASLRLNAFDAIERTLLAELETIVEATEQVVEASRAQVEARQARAALAQRERDRMAALREEGQVSQSVFEEAELAAETAVIDLRAEELSLRAMEAMLTVVRLGPTYVEHWLERKGLVRGEIEQRLAQARSRLELAEHELARAAVRAPIDGVVLERLHQGDATLPAGTELLVLGDLSTLEVVAEVLTEDALLLSPGSPVELASLAFEGPLAATVARVEPAGFTRLSALGVEQQRVNVIAALPDPPASLGPGYRLHARFLVAARDDALLVPRPAVLESPAGQPYVLLVENGRLVRRDVELGIQSDLELEIRAGLEEGTPLLAAPDATLREGERVRPVP